MKSCLLIFLFLLLASLGFSQSCTLGVKLSQSSPTICSGNSITLTATTSGGTGPFSYVWSTGETSSAINVNKAGTYTVSVSDKTPGCQPVKQSISVAVSSTPNAPFAKGATTCQNSSATLTATGPGGVYQWYDAPTGGNFLATGDTYTTPALSSSTTFYVETTIAGCTSPRTAVFALVTGKPGVTGASICAGNVATISATGGDSYTWYDAPAGGNVVGSGPSFTTPVLNTSAVYYVTATANGCTSARTLVFVKVSPPPAAPTASSMVVCAGSSANLHADGQPGVIFNWYDVPFGGTPLISSPDYTTPALNSTTVYYVETSLNQCESPRTKVTVSINATPPVPANQNDTTCYGTSAALKANGAAGSAYQWYDAATGGNLLATGAIFNTPALKTSTTYYLQADNGGCGSPQRATISVFVKPQMPPPSVSGSIICSASSTTLTATGPGGNYTWYDSAVGGKLLGAGDTYTTPVLKANTTYFVQTNIGGCISPRAAVTVTVLTAITPPTAAGVTVCSGSSATLNATGPYNSYAWYDAAAGGNLLSSAQVFVTPALANTTSYYVETSSGGCTSTRTKVTVTVNPTPQPPTANNVTICPGTSATLTATAPSGTIQWYDAPSGGNLVQGSKTYVTPVLFANTTYYAQNTVGQCISNRTAVTVSVTALANPEFQYSSGTFCATGPNPTPIINNPAGGTFTAAPAGLVFVSNTTGQINISASTPGKYVISFTNNNPCPITTSAKIAVVTTTNASFSYNGPYCQGGANPLPTFPGGSSAGDFSAAPAGLVFVNTSTGQIDLSQSQPGTYTVTNTINASGGCPAAVATTSVTIDPGVIVVAGPPQTVPVGSTVQLAGSITGGTTTGTWSGGTGSFSNASLLNAVYTPGPGEKVAILTLTSSNPPGPCGPKSDKVVITIGVTPSAPTAAGSSICAGSGTILSATAPGGIYQWYDANAGGNLLATGPTFTTPALIANTTYYVETTNNGVTSARTPVTVTINNPPVAPVAAGTQICEGSITTLTASGSAGTYQWYDSPNGGNLLSTNASYVTSGLTTNTSFYVQATTGTCVGPRTKVDVLVTPISHITSASTGTICSGTPQNYAITADQAAATFLWSRAAAPGISNPGVANQNSPTINETLINTTPGAINVPYIITPVIGNCSGPAFNYIVTVNPTPVVTSAGKATICNENTDNYTVTFSTPVMQFSWDRPAVPGISNIAVTGQRASIIKEVLFNTTNAPVDVTYTFNSQTSACPGVPFNLVITVNPTPLITSSPTGVACSGDPQGYVITSNIPTATYSWSRAAVPNISNPAVTNQTSGTINEALNNTSPSPVLVVYTITPFANGCPGTPFTYTTNVNPPLVIPVANCNSPVCSGNTIHLRTGPVAGATYLWTGPGAFTSTSQNPDITNITAANSGTYTLVLTVNGCNSLPATTQAVVDEPPVVDAGPDQVVCIANPSIFLTGTISVPTATGIWTTQGTGTFSSNIDLNAQYFPTAADKAAGAVKLILTSASKDDCAISTDTVVIKFGPLPAVYAGASQSVCSQATSIPLNGRITIPGGILWSSSGTGTFSPAPDQLNAAYMPSAADIKAGSVELTILAAKAGVCDIPTDSLKITFVPPPTVNAGGVRYVLRGNTITLDPTVNYTDVKYLWSPNIDINDITAKNPVITGVVNRTYTLTVTDTGGCVGVDSTFIKVSPALVINNTFTPNGDGINDVWTITGLVAYENATVDVFTRYGQKIYHSLGYDKPWDGTYNGKQLPVGVYYYVINTNLNGQVLSGYVTILR